jgi:hypothetical protein
VDECDADDHIHPCAMEREGRWRTHGPLRILRGHFELASSALAVAVCLHVGSVDSAVEVERRERKCAHDKEARF